MYRLDRSTTRITIVSMTDHVLTFLIVHRRINLLTTLTAIKCLNVPFCCVCLLKPETPDTTRVMLLSLVLSCRLGHYTWGRMKHFL